MMRFLGTLGVMSSLVVFVVVFKSISIQKWKLDILKANNKHEKYPVYRNVVNISYFG